MHNIWQVKYLAEKENCSWRILIWWYGGVCLKFNGGIQGKRWIHKDYYEEVLT